VQFDSEFISIYQEHFIPAYANVVTAYADKPQEIILELESAFTHIMTAEIGNNPAENMEKARGHLYRATLDCYKFMWLKITSVIDDAYVHRDAYKSSEKELLVGYDEYKAALNAAREFELSSIGKTDRNMGVLNKWRDAVTKGKEVYDKIDVKKLNRLIKWATRNGLKFWLYSLAVCVLGGLIVLTVDKFF